MTNRRLHPTLADYVAIAINPVLVMGLVGSLIYFLLEVLYQGAYPERLQFCLTMFIFAIVLISRIAMEDGFEHAAPFGVALAVVVALALNRFVEYGNGALAQFGWIINWALMALTWWCAHQLTWDCTVIDDSEEIESQGLLETVGIDKATGQPTVPERPPEAAEHVERRGRVLAGWEQVLNRKGRPHAPGVWVVYFSLASLPIFGIGQLCIPASNTASRRYVFGLLCVYVACGLGLLLTTSFLALRRYLRRRRLEMPPIMAGTWLVTGGILIVALLLLVALLPRPNPEYAISELPWKFSSSEHGSAKLSAGQEGTKDDQAEAGSGVDLSRDPQAQNDSTSGTGKQPAPDAQDSAARADSGQERGSAEQGGRAGEQGQSQSDGKQAQDKSDQAQQSQQTQAKPNPSKQADSQQPNRDSKSDNTPANQNSAKTPPRTPPPSESNADSPTLPQSLSLAVGGWLATVFKGLLYAALIAAMIYFGWQSRERLLAIVHGWLAGWREFWNELWGRPKTNAGNPAAPAEIYQPPRTRFRDFVDPFAAGSARQHSPAELAKYTFAALEAWGREHGCQRPPEATPHEFARQLGSQFQPLAAGSRLLADLFCRAVYSSGDLPAENLDQLRRLWAALRAIDTQVVATSARV